MTLEYCQCWSSPNSSLESSVFCLLIVSEINSYQETNMEYRIQVLVSGMMTSSAARCCIQVNDKRKMEIYSNKRDLLT